MLTERVVHGGRQLAIILRGGGDDEPGTRFVTSPEAPLQLGEINAPAGHRIAAHAHNLGARTIVETHEFLHVLSGTVRVSLYDVEDRAPVAQRDLTAGDAILLTGGAHGFEFLTACRLIEVKQGPYLGHGDKTPL